MPLPGDHIPLLLTALALLLLPATNASFGELAFREAPAFRNGAECQPPTSPSSSIHIAMTLDSSYVRGSIAGVHSVLRHATCPENLVFHFLATANLRPTITSTFPSITFHIHHFDPSLVAGMISPSLRPALDQPLNYARIYLADLLPTSVPRVIYLDSDLIVVDDISRLWSTPLGPSTILAAPEYCHANFTSYFTPRFWSDPLLPTLAFGTKSRTPCYFNTGVMVLDLSKWRSEKCRERLEWWMRVQKRRARIYELGSLPPFLLVFGGEVRGVDHRWNQHGLGGDNVEGLCRDLHPGKVSLLHWSGKGKPWLRLDQGRPCPLDRLWAPYDLYTRTEEVVAEDDEFVVDG